MFWVSENLGSLRYVWPSPCEKCTYPHRQIVKTHTISGSRGSFRQSHISCPIEWLHMSVWRLSNCRTLQSLFSWDSSILKHALGDLPSAAEVTIATDRYHILQWLGGIGDHWYPSVPMATNDGRRWFVATVGRNLNACNVYFRGWWGRSRGRQL